MDKESNSKAIREKEIMIKEFFAESLREWYYGFIYSNDSRFILSKLFWDVCLPLLLHRVLLHRGAVKTVLISKWARRMFILVDLEFTSLKRIFYTTNL